MPWANQIPMKSHTFALLRAIITAAALTAVFLFAYWSDFDHYVGWPVVCAGFGACALLVLLTFVTGARHGLSIAGIYAVPAICCVILAAAGVAIDDGNGDLGLRLTVTGIPDGGTPLVAWSERDASGNWQDTPWETVRVSPRNPAFTSKTTVRYYSHSAPFLFKEGWSFGAQSRPIVIVIDQRRFRFEPETLFGRGGHGRIPGEVAATVDVSGYLSGKQMAPPIDFPPDNPTPPGRGDAQ